MEMKAFMKNINGCFYDIGHENKINNFLMNENI